MSNERDEKIRRQVRRTVLILALVALAIYVGTYLRQVYG